MYNQHKQNSKHMKILDCKIKGLTILFLLILVSVSNAWAQTIVKPTYNRRDNISLKITEIERNSQYTIIKGVYNNYLGFKWAYIENTTCLKDSQTGERLGTIIRSEGLPMSPDRHIFSKEEDNLPFVFYFPAVAKNVIMVDMIEDENNVSAFNFYGISLVERPFSVTYNIGHKLSFKPSLPSRINGVKEIQAYVPLDLTKLDAYIFGNFISYLEGLGIRVDVIQAEYGSKTEQVGPIQAYYRVLQEDVGDHLKNSNTLAAVLTYVWSMGSYVDGKHIKITFIDYVNDFRWDIKGFELPNKADKYINVLKQYITSTYNFNAQYSFIPPSVTSTWNEAILRNYLSQNVIDPLEGIFKGDKYTIGVKKGNDGKYYLLYLAGADNHDDWKEGDIKATLTATALPTLFKADWLGKRKQNMDMTIKFMDGALVTIDKNKDQETYIKMFPDVQTTIQNSVSSGSGFFLSEDGYIITNHHVIENARTISVSGINDDYKTSYSARVEISDKQNDLAILKITDAAFKPTLKIPYTFKYTNSSVGENCFVLGYPLISTMGTDIKLTNGIISSRTGFEGNIAEYQMSAPVQPGNSGGPLFDKDGNIIGVVCAKHRDAENVGYAIKASYIRNLVEMLPTKIAMPQTNMLTGKTLPQQVKLASKSVCMIIVNDD